MNIFAVQQLSILKLSRILEIGFGGGSTLQYLIDNGRFVAAVDRSRDMVGRAKAKFSNDVDSGTATFQEGTVDALPFSPWSFDRILTVNTVYFWESLDRGFREIHRIVAPRGVVIVGFLPKEFMDRMGMPKDIFTSRTTDEVVMAAQRAGLSDVRIQKATTRHGVGNREMHSAKRSKLCDPRTCAHQLLKRDRSATPNPADPLFCDDLSQENSQSNHKVAMDAFVPAQARTDRPQFPNTCRFSFVSIDCGNPEFSRGDRGFRANKKAGEVHGFLTKPIRSERW